MVSVPPPSYASVTSSHVATLSQFSGRSFLPVGLSSLFGYRVWIFHSQCARIVTHTHTHTAWYCPPRQTNDRPTAEMVDHCNPLSHGLWWLPFDSGGDWKLIFVCWNPTLCSVTAESAGGKWNKNITVRLYRWRWRDWNTWNNSRQTVGTSFHKSDDSSKKCESLFRLFAIKYVCFGRFEMRRKERAFQR